MVLGFKKRFVDRILKGTKIHTIREDKNNRWKQGNSIQFATGVRTKMYDQFMSGECISIQRFDILYHVPIDNSRVYRICYIYIDDELFSTVSFYRNDRPVVNSHVLWFFLKDFVKADGFDTIDDFLDWFSDDFSGKIIHWTDKTY